MIHLSPSQLTKPLHNEMWQYYQGHQKAYILALKSDCQKGFVKDFTFLQAVSRSWWYLLSTCSAPNLWWYRETFCVLHFLPQFIVKNLVKHWRYRTLNIELYLHCIIICTCTPSLDVFYTQLLYSTFITLSLYNYFNGCGLPKGL